MKNPSFLSVIITTLIILFLIYNYSTKSKYQPVSLPQETLDMLEENRRLFQKIETYDDAIKDIEKIDLRKDLIQIKENIEDIKNAKYFYDLASGRINSYGRDTYVIDMSKEDWNYVVENLNQCLDLDSDFLFAYLIRGYAYYFLGEYRKSMKDYKKITRIPKYRFESTDELLLLSMAHIRLGDVKLKLELNYCREYKKACDLGLCDAYNKHCK
jgi:tetratricopeptide (TPR) repeat protein